MSQVGTNKDQLSVGLEVEINPQSDKTRKKLVSGVIKEFLSGSMHHTHGILVKLENGEVGRVKNILSRTSDVITSEKQSDQKCSSTSDEQSLKDLIIGGENHYVEFKSSMLWSTKLSKEDIVKSLSPDVKRYGKNASKVITARTLAGFLNSDGGYLIIGVKENKRDVKDEIIGIESEYDKLTDKCIDGYRRMIIDGVIKPYLPSTVFNHINNYIRIIFEEIENKTICGIQAIKSHSKVFLKINKKDLFFVRVDASTRQIHGEEVVDYCLKRFD